MKDTTLSSTPTNPAPPIRLTPPNHLAIVYRLAWTASIASALYLAIALGTGTSTQNPLAIGGLLLLGIGLTRQARHRLHH